MFTPKRVVVLTYQGLRDFVMIARIYSVNSTYRVMETADRQSALNLAIINNDKEFFDFLLDHGADACRSTIHVEPPIFVACRFGRKEMLEKLIKFGADVNTRYDLAAKDYARCISDNGSKFVNEEWFKPMIMEDSDEWDDFEEDGVESDDFEENNDESDNFEENRDERDNFIENRDESDNFEENRDERDNFEENRDESDNFKENRDESDNFEENRDESDNFKENRDESDDLGKYSYDN